MKQVKEFKSSPVEQELGFVNWCKEKNVTMVLADGDDTLWSTGPIFNKQMEKCYDLLTQTGLLNRETWKNEIETINDRFFENHGVNPIRWNNVIQELSKFGLDNIVLKEAKSILAKIYQTPPVFIKDTESGLDFINKVNIPFGIVTHANAEWTKRKFDWLKLNRFINLDDIYIIDENSHKNEETWLSAMDYFKVKPENCLVIGDSPRSDINPVCRLGVQNCFLIQNEYDVWTVHQQPVDEIKTRPIKSVYDLRWLAGEIIHR